MMGGLFSNGIAKLPKLLESPKSSMDRVLDSAGSVRERVGGIAGSIPDPASLLDKKKEVPSAPAPKSGSSMLTGK